MGTLSNSEDPDLSYSLETWRVHNKWLMDYLEIIIERFIRVMALVLDLIYEHS